MGFWSFVREHGLLSGLVGAVIVAIATGAALFIGLRDGSDNQSLIERVRPTTTSPTTVPSPPPSPFPDENANPTPESSPDLTPPIPSVSPLESGAVLEESLERPGDTDEWSFLGSRGQFVEVRMDRDPTGNVKPDITVIDRFGNEVAHDDSYTGYAEEYAQIEYWLESTGEFTIVAQDRFGKGIGKYRMAFNMDPFTEVASGATISSEISRLGENDRYIFQGQAGQTVKIRADRDPTGNLKPEIRLLDPFRVEEGRATSYTGYEEEYAQLEKELSDTGTFMIVIQDRLEDGIGKYTLEVTLR